MKNILSILPIIPILLILLALSPITAFSQTKPSINISVIVSDSIGKSLKDVAIYNSKQKLIGITNNFGTTTITAHYGDAVVFSHISYEQKTIKISDENIFDKNENACSMLVVLNPKTNMLPEAEIVENMPHLAYSNKQVWVSDYKITDRGMYLILDSNTEHSLMFLSHEQDTLAKAKINKKFDYLYEDAFGNIHLLSNDSAYQTYYDGEKLNMLYPVDIASFKQKLMPVKVITDSLLILQKYTSMYQEILYVSVNRNNKEIKVLADLYGYSKEAADNYYIDMMRDGRIDGVLSANPLFPTLHKQLFRDASEQPFDISQMNNPMSMKPYEDFENSPKMRYVYDPIYCPIVFFNQTIYIFDFEKDRLLKYADNGVPLYECDMTFHRKKHFKNYRIGDPWDRKLIFDKALGKCYAQFTKDGLVTLKEIDLQTGKIKNEIKLTQHTYPENIQIHNGIVYYKFIDVRQTVGRDCRSLYKMQLK
jgi:hypothetical protein